jgi:leader peptidase (prepilin peptidase)/N-methyltransferase
LFRGVFGHKLALVFSAEGWQDDLLYMLESSSFDFFNWHTFTIHWLTLLGVVLAGWLLGSFCTVLAYRIPREIPLGLFSHTRSRCPKCDCQIPWHHNVPLFAYLALKGKCANCGVKIPTRYFLIELSTVLLFALTYIIYESSAQKPLDSVVYWAELVKLLYFTLALIATTFIDLEFRIIPDRFSLGNWVVALAASFLWGQPDLLDAILGGLIGFGAFYLLAWGYKKIKGIDGLGFGDVKMMGWLGAWVGALAVPFVILIASVTGLIAGVLVMLRSKEGMQTAIPFGPFLALGAYIAWVFSALGYFADGSG